MAQTSGISGVRILVLSRCAQTLHRFRSALLLTLKARGARVTALGARGEGYEHKLRAAGIDYRHVPVSLRGVAPIADCWLFLRLLLLFRRERPAVIHAFTIKPAIYATLAAAVAGVPARIVTITGLGHAFTTAPAPLRAVVEFLYRAALHRATLVFFQNGDDRRLFIERRLVDPAKVRLVAGSGVDLTRFSVEPLPSERGATPRFLMIGRLLVEKGVREFLEAARLVHATHPQVVFTLIGGSDSRNPSNLPAAEVERLQASPDVQWIGEVDDVRPHVAACDVVVLPSYREGLPRALLEGAAMGRALIGTDAPGCREVVREGVNGYLVPVADGQALADSMLRYLAEPAAIRVHGAQSRKIAEQEFDEGVVISRFIDSYEEGLRVVSA
jgi:glycosyltransferase involved in cell wall biosynthesis